MRLKLEVLGFVPTGPGRALRWFWAQGSPVREYRLEAQSQSNSQNERKASREKHPGLGFWT